MASLNRIEYAREVHARAVKLFEELEELTYDGPERTVPPPTVEDLAVNLSALSDIVKELARSHRELFVIVLQLMG